LLGPPDLRRDPVKAAGGFKPGQVGTEDKKDRGLLNPYLGSGQVGDLFPGHFVPDPDKGIGLDMIGSGGTLGRLDKGLNQGVVNRLVCKFSDRPVGG
jgi:hypothetical protein